MSIVSERIAAAMWRRWDVDVESKLHADDPEGAMMILAMAALEAMQEPTPDQSFAGGGVVLGEVRMRKSDGHIILGMNNAEKVWRKMVSEARRDA